MALRATSPDQKTKPNQKEQIRRVKGQMRWPPKTKICLFASLHLNPQLLLCETYLTQVWLISLGFSHRWRTKKKFSLHSPCLVSKNSHSRNCQWSLSISWFCSRVSLKFCSFCDRFPVLLLDVAPSIDNHTIHTMPLAHSWSQEAHKGWLHPWTM